jgi:hypothetical protein
MTRRANLFALAEARRAAAELVTRWDYATLQDSRAADRLVSSWGLERADAASIVAAERRRRSAER